MGKLSIFAVSMFYKTKLMEEELVIDNPVYIQNRIYTAYGK